MPQAQRYLTTVEAAAELGISDRRVRVLCAEGRLGAKFGRNYLITPQQVAKFKRTEQRLAGRPPKE